MKKILSIVAIIIILGLVIVTVGMGSMSDENYETTTEFGAWGQEILIQYDDGTEESLKPIMSNPLNKMVMSITHEGKKVSQFTYILKCQATGTGPDTIEVDVRDFYVNWVLKYGSTVRNTFVYDTSAIERTIATNAGWQTVFSAGGTINNVAPEGKMSINTPYTLEIKPTGSIKYNYGDGLITATLPDTISLTVKRVSDVSLTVIFSQDPNVQ